MTQAGAKFLKENLDYYAGACRSDVRAIRQSVLWQAVQLYEAPTTKRQFFTEAIKDRLKEDGPWIRAFAERVTARAEPKKADRQLLERILADAPSHGRARARFYSKQGRLLKAPLQAFLIELCLGGPYWWRHHNLTPPFDVAQKELALSCSRTYGEGRGTANFYRRNLGPQWKTLMTGSSQRIPLPIHRLLSPPK